MQLLSTNVKEKILGIGQILSMVDYDQLVPDFLMLSPETESKVIVSVVSVSILYFFRAIVLRGVESRTQNEFNIYTWRKLSWYVFVFLSFILVGRVWYTGVGDFVTFFGFFIAGLVVVLNQPIASIAGWAYVVIRRPFVVGDRIRVGMIAGDVADIRLFSTVIAEVDGLDGASMPTGRLAHIPNKVFMEEPLFNSSKGLGLLWNELGVEVTFESDWKKAKEIFLDIVGIESQDMESKAKSQMRKVFREYKLRLGSFRPEVFTSVTPSGVHFSLRYLVELTDKRQSEERIWEKVLTEIGNCEDIDFAYPTRRTFINHIEGKEGAKAPAWPPVVEEKSSKKK
jgi:small-conductance mechanosensitive channel